MKNCGYLIISLDYELMWGVIDTATVSDYGRSNVCNVPYVMDRTLELFQRYGVKATVATVGMTTYENPTELIDDMPKNQPTYYDSRKSPYQNNLIPSIREEDYPLYFQPSIFKKLLIHPNVEIGTHTYCHFYCDEPGGTLEQFEVDIKAAVKRMTDFGIPVTSIVFPRNNISEPHIEICSRHGITSYRGNSTHFFSGKETFFKSFLNRICRLIDCYVNIGGYTSFPLSDIENRYGVLDVRASRMLRPYFKPLGIIDTLRYQRIKKEMIYAAKNGQVYHLWWHPHNFGADSDKNFKILEKICKLYAKLNKEYGFKSCTMSDFQKEFYGYKK